MLQRQQSDCNLGKCHIITMYKEKPRPVNSVVEFSVWFTTKVDL